MRSLGIGGALSNKRSSESPKTITAVTDKSADTIEYETRHI
jgi:hypothetical protein